MKNIIFLIFPFIFCIPQINAGQFGIDLGIGSSYDLTSTRSWYGTSSSGQAKLSGSDLRFLYYSDMNLSYGLRLASHEGKDTTGLPSGYAYKISISETSPFVKYSNAFNTAGDSVIEGFFVGGLNLATMKVSHTILAESSASTTGLMLEGGIFAGIKKDDMTFGGGISLPIDSYEGNFQWDVYGYTLDYKATVKKNLSIFLIFKTKI
jgi:hypothetical protein